MYCKLNGCFDLVAQYERNGDGYRPDFTSQGKSQHRAGAALDGRGIASRPALWRVECCSTATELGDRAHRLVHHGTGRILRADRTVLRVQSPRVIRFDLASQPCAVVARPRPARSFSRTGPYSRRAAYSRLMGAEHSNRGTHSSSFQKALCDFSSWNA